MSLSLSLSLSLGLCLASGTAHALCATADRELEVPQADAPEGGITIPVYVHLVRPAQGPGDNAYWSGEDVVEALNTTFGGRFEATADVDPPMAPSPFHFVLAGTDRPRSSDLYHLRLADSRRAELAAPWKKPGIGVLNVFLVGPTDGDEVAGIAQLPGVPDAPGNGDAVFLHGDAASDSRTLAHETGHWLGLRHTFEGGCLGKGDEIDDTPPMAAGEANHFQCHWDFLTDTCPGGGPDPLDSFMSYDMCSSRFTPGQVRRMVAVWLFLRDDGSGGKGDGVEPGEADAAGCSTGAGSGGWPLVLLALAYLARRAARTSRSPG